MNDKKTVVLADSNLVAATSVPAELEILALRGARISHAVKAIRSYRPSDPSRKLKLILQIGINNRSDSTPMLDDEIEQLQTALDENTSIDQVYVLGISYSQDLPQFCKDRIDQYNDLMMMYVGVASYISPLPDNEVEIQPGDRYGIHYTPSTIDRLLQKISTAVSSTLF